MILRNVLFLIAFLSVVGCAAKHPRNGTLRHDIITGDDMTDTSIKPITFTEMELVILNQLVEEASSNAELDPVFQDAMTSLKAKLSGARP